MSFLNHFATTKNVLAKSALEAPSHVVLKSASCSVSHCISYPVRFVNSRETTKTIQNMQCRKRNSGRTVKYLQNTSCDFGRKGCREARGNANMQSSSFFIFQYLLQSLICTSFSASLSFPFVMTFDHPERTRHEHPTRNSRTIASAHSLRSFLLCAKTSCCAAVL